VLLIEGFNFGLKMLFFECSIEVLKIMLFFCRSECLVKAELYKTPKEEIPNGGKRMGVGVK
jgi:hypothetical protein